MNRFPEIRVFIEQDNLLASSTALSLAKLAVEYHNLSILTHMRDYESENVRVARHLHGQFSSVDQRTFYGSQNGPKMYICGKAVCARSHLSALDRPLKQSLGQVMVSTRGQESRRITYTHMIPKWSPQYDSTLPGTLCPCPLIGIRFIWRTIIAPDAK